MRYAAVSRNRRCFYTQGGMFYLGGRTFRLLGKEQELDKPGIALGKGGEERR